jgi:hypothetical protein
VLVVCAAIAGVAINASAVSEPIRVFMGSSSYTALMRHAQKLRCATAVAK